MKIMLANVGVSEKDGFFITNMMGPNWKKNFNKVRRPDTEIVLRVSEWGILGMDGFFHPAIDTLNFRPAAPPRPMALTPSSSPASATPCWTRCAPL